PGVRDRQLNTHGESRSREGFHVQAGDDGDLGPVVLGDGGRGRAELDERGEPSGHRPGGGKPAVELPGVLGLECPFVGHLANEIEGAEGDGGGGEGFQGELAAETLLLGSARDGGGEAGGDKDPVLHRAVHEEFVLDLEVAGSPDTRMRARPLDARQPLRPDQAPTSMAGGAAASGVRLAGRGGLLRPHAPYSAMILPLAVLWLKSPMKLYEPFLSAGIRRRMT